MVRKYFSFLRFYDDFLDFFDIRNAIFHNIFLTKALQRCKESQDVKCSLVHRVYFLTQKYI